MSQFVFIEPDIQIEFGQNRGGEGVGVRHDHVHHKELAKIFLLNIPVVILSVENNKSHNNVCIVIIDDYCYRCYENRDCQTWSSLL